MRASIALLVFVVFSVPGLLRAAERCTPAWASDVALQAERDPKQAREALRPIGDCPNADELLRGIASIKRGTGPAHPHQTRQPALPSQSAPGSATTSGKPAAGGLTPVPIPKVDPPGKTIDPAVQDAALGLLKKRLQAGLERMHGCGGFAKCDQALLRAWIASLNAYLALIIAAGNPADQLREAGDLIAQAAVDSPALRMAEQVARTFEQLSKADKERFSKATGISASFSDETTVEKIRTLLQKDDLLKQAYAQVAFFKAQSYAVGGRAVVVWLDLARLGPSRCDKLLQRRVVAAFDRTRPAGVVFYRSNEGAQVIVTVGPTPAQPGSADCDGDASQQCLQLSVSGSFSQNGNTTWSSQFAREPIYSRPGNLCESLSDDQLETLASAAIHSFAIDLSTTHASNTTAQVVPEGCLEVRRKDNPAFLEAVAQARLARANHDTGAFQAIILQTPTQGPEGFTQELSEALRSQRDILGDATTNLPELGHPIGVSLSWEQPRADKAVSPITVTARLNRPGAAADAQLEILPKAEKGCDLRPIPFQRAAAREVSIWLLRIATGPRDAVPPVVPQLHHKNWAYAPLGLLLAGLPQLADDDPSNNTRGAVMAGVDLVLLATSAVLVFSSIEARNTYADSRQPEHLERANTRLHQAYWVGGFALAPRFVSIAW